jgi:hypothetical protein
MAEDEVRYRIPSTRMCMVGDVGQLRALSATAGPPFFSDTPSPAQVEPPPEAVAAVNEAIAEHPESFPKDLSGAIGVLVTDTSDNPRSGPRVEPHPKACPAPAIS